MNDIQFKALSDLLERVAVELGNLTKRLVLMEQKLDNLVVEGEDD